MHRIVQYYYCMSLFSLNYSRVVDKEVQHSHEEFSFSLYVYTKLFMYAQEFVRY